MKQQVSPNTSISAREKNIVHFKEICLEVVSETQNPFCWKSESAKKETDWKLRRDPRSFVAKMQ